MKSLGEELKSILISHGAALVGFADLYEVAEEVRDGYPNGISIAVALKPEIINRVDHGPTQEYFDEYMRCNHLLDSLDVRAADLLKGKGYKALAKVRASVQTDLTNHTTKLPHKTVATRAGLGWIGKCALLITREFGAAVRLSTVLTDAPLEAAEPINKSKCGKCTVCVSVCPALAPTGQNWEVGLPRAHYYDFDACNRYAEAMSNKNGLPETICGLCVLACPFTRKHLEGQGVEYSLKQITRDINI
ncbi:MAG: 4Fe-4S double cluster binding domain-containing protein [Candidatus Saccharibacteria bacterium]